ncbi:1-deoxy-D-xylulose-5-phosphate synthase [bacterium]|nr:1-deoxy-D-xylulose-5-phosphate synthase [bacterium]
MHRILDTIQSPRDLQSLDITDLRRLADELREFVTESVSRTGGHLAPNLGVIELTLALHTAFDAPEDKIIWDVGHQAYVHKILTGRRDRFHTLRQTGGISGFPKITESEYDAFGAGHASTAISAALGMAAARDLKGESHSVIAVVGDGAMTGGLAFEGLNNAGAAKRDLIVVLNDNTMSIAPNVGALSRYLNKLIAAPAYNRVKTVLWHATQRSGFLRRSVRRIDEVIKALLVPSGFFERMGFRYFGPVDGHDLPELLWILREIRKLHGPILLHVMTTKGKGYKYAEEDATRFHGISSFCLDTGKTPPRRNPSYTDVFGETMIRLAEADPSIAAITAAMANGTGLCEFAVRFPSRFFDVGIAEQHAVTFAAGLARQGMRPVVAIYSTFLQRALDSIIHDVALQNLPVVFAVDRGGLVGEDGPTHHGCFDLTFLRMIPNLVVMAPKDENEFRDMLYTAVRHPGPVAVRYPRSETLGLPEKSGFAEIPIGRSETVREGRDAAVFAVGDMVQTALEAAGRLAHDGLSVRVVNARFVKPVDRQALEEAARSVPALFTLENNTGVGGFGSGVSEALSEMHPLGTHLPDVRVRRIALPDRFVPHGSLRDLFLQTGLDPESVAEVIRKAVRP